MTDRTCSIEGCDKPHFGREMCRLHYARWWRHGDPLEEAATRTYRPAIDRLMAHVTMTPGPLASDCWVSTYGDNGAGYTRITVDGRTMYAHRFSYEQHVGPIPAGLELDHLCRVPRCVNPAHLEPVTTRINTLRSDNHWAVAARTGVCKRGHSLDDAYVSPQGRRRCRTCAKIQDKARDRSGRHMGDVDAVEAGHQPNVTIHTAPSNPLPPAPAL